MTDLTAATFPMLREDGSSLDWPDATYEAKIAIGIARAKVGHYLEGAPQLQELVTAGKAEWVVELRSPATLYTRILASSQERGYTFEWDTDVVVSGSYVIPGMVTTQEVELDAHGLHALWGTGPIVVRPGRWLVRGSARSAEQLGSSLIKLFPDKNVTNGQMTVTPFTGEGDLRFHVKISPKMFETRARDRDVQIAALIAAFGRIPGVVRESAVETLDEQGESTRYPVLERLRGVLADANVADWTNPSEYDPARAATEVEAFFVLERASEADDE